MRAILALLAVPALALAGCDKAASDADAPTAKAGPGIPAPAGGWVAQVAATPEGGFRMGNPDAPAKLVEYASYTCPHCAAFATEAMPGIRRLVATGRLSYELRSFVRDPIDLAAALLARCGGPKPFFPLSDQLFAGQQEWLGNAQTITPADQKKIATLPPEQQLAALAHGIGLNAYAGQRGLPEARSDGCLTDKAAQERVVAVREDAEKRWKVDGTPTFILNGENVGSLTWAGLRPRLDAAVAG